jgi:hypothetical protein
MVSHIGEERAALILDAAIRNAAVAEGQYFAEKVRGQTSMADFIQLYENWTNDGALEMKVLEASDTVLISTSRVASMPRPSKKWAWARLATCCPATLMARFAKGMTQKLLWSANKPSWLVRLVAPSDTATTASLGLSLAVLRLNTYYESNDFREHQKVR